MKDLLLKFINILFFGIKFSSNKIYLFVLLKVNNFLQNDSKLKIERHIPFSAGSIPVIPTSLSREDYIGHFKAR
ncbi:MAG: hypothetical protein ACD_79C01437G0001, partial [uncultured bacterium]